MPSRILREGILTSTRVDQLSSGAEIFYRRLMSVVDDYGRYHSHPTLLRAATFPLKMDKVTDDHVARWLAELVKAGLVREYEANGQKCLEYLYFRQQTRSASKFPAPCEANDKQMPSKCLATASQDDKQMPSVVVVEGVVEVTTSVDSGESTTTPDNSKRATNYTDDFTAFWNQYPNAPSKGGKTAAFKAWKKLSADERVRASEAAEVFSEAWSRATKGKEYVPNASTWLNEGRWDDDLKVLAAQWADKYGVYA